MSRDQRYYRAFLQSRSVNRRGLLRALLKGVRQSAPLPPSVQIIRPIWQGECQNPYLYCDSCADYCHAKAITWRARERPVLQLESCDGCGECVLRCPTAALVMTTGV